MSYTKSNVAGINKLNKKLTGLATNFSNLPIDGILNNTFPYIASVFTKLASETILLSPLVL